MLVDVRPDLNPEHSVSHFLSLFSCLGEPLYNARRERSGTGIRWMQIVLTETIFQFPTPETNGHVSGELF